MLLHEHCTDVSWGYACMLPAGVHTSLCRHSLTHESSHVMVACYGTGTSKT